MKKLAIILMSFILILVVGLYFASGLILAKVSDKLLDYVTENVKIPNLEYTRPSFGSVRWSAWNAVKWTDVSMDARLVRNEAIKVAEDISLNIGEMTVSLENFSRRTFLLSAGGLSVKEKAKAQGADLPGAANYIEGANFETMINFDGLGMAGIRARLHALKEEIQQFTTLGVTKMPLSFSATTKFELQGKLCTARLSVENKGEEYRLVMDKSDLEKIVSQMTGKKPNPVDIAVIARNPVKAPLLIKIRDKAEATALLATQQNPKFPEDAYRHILWSYLLTKAYGEQFAKEVTDAHEAYADEEEIQKQGLINWTSASYQDLVNNALGRQYATLGYSEPDILERILFDPAVIRDDEAVKRFNAADYEKLKPLTGKPK
ncbi:MAG: hypothetical protein Q8O28_10845 [Smithellaceae bacterium]|nr:hypothetical protein [Smithellaceae bacterium]